jgi:hypothetical protein
MRILRLLFCVPILALASPALGASDSAEPSPVHDIVYVQRFTLDEGYRHDWSLDRQFVTSGTLVVLKVDPELVIPRNAAEPVLYVGDQTAQRLNHGHESGLVIAIVPGDVDLEQAPIWFGSPSLPERASAESIRMERAAADVARIQPFSEEKIRGLTQSPLRADNLQALLREHVADLVLEYSPQERHLAESWRLPVAR